MAQADSATCKSRPDQPQRLMTSPTGSPAARAAIISTRAWLGRRLGTITAPALTMSSPGPYATAAGRTCMRPSVDLCCAGGSVELVDVYAAQECAGREDHDGAIRFRTVLNDLFDARRTWGIAGTGIVAELLLAGGAEGDLREVEAVVDRLAATPADDVWAAREIVLLGLRGLLARARRR